MLKETNGNEEYEAAESNGGRQYSDPEINYGWFGVRPRCMQILLKPLLCVMILVGTSVTSVILMYMVPAVERTLKTRYKLSDKDVTGLNTAQGISLMLSVILLGYFGSFWSKMKIRVIAVGMALSGVGAIFFAIPHFKTEEYKPHDFPEVALNAFGLCRMSFFPCNEQGVKDSHMAFFVIGQILIGVGVAPLFCLVPAYIDENINPKWMPIAVMLWYGGLSIGPVTGLAGAGIFQMVYIDIDQPKLLHQMDTKDFRWLGAWWFGYIVFGVMTIFHAFIVGGFPVSLPGAQSRRNEHILKGHIPTNDDKMTLSPVGFLYTTAKLLKNKSYMFNTLANLCIVFFLYALGPFIVQVLFIKYGADPFKILMPVIIVLLLGCAVGVATGGYITNRVGVKNLAKGAAFVCLATQALCILGPLVFVIPGCNESNIAGVTKEYPAIGGVPMAKMGKNGSSEISTACNAHCGCNTVMSQPVCGSNNVAYFDPCHAGCQLRPTDNDYINCTCIPPSIPGMKFGTAKKGFCDRGCGSWKIFLFVAFIAVVLLGTNIVPSRVVVLRCVQENQRSYALAVQTFLYTLVAFIPTHLVKYIMHKDCNIWQRDPCGRKGICWDYDTNSMSKSMTIFGLIVTALATTFYFFSWHTYEPPRTHKMNRLLSDTSTAPDEDDGKETKL